MGIYNTYIGPAVRYLTYLAFLATIIIFGLEVRKIYQSNCRIVLFDALGKPLIPAMVFMVLFFWKNINEFVSRSSLVGGTNTKSKEKKQVEPSDSPDTKEE